jgi:hypothetical protein
MSAAEKFVRSGLLTERPVNDETSSRYAGWRVVLACFLVELFIFGFGLYGHGVYVAELQRLRGWSAPLISGAITLTFLLSSIFATFTHELVARLGSKRLILLGIAALSASTILLAFATEPWQLYAAFILMALGWTGMGVVVIATNRTSRVTAQLAARASLSAGCGRSRLPELGRLRIRPRSRIEAEEGSARRGLERGIDRGTRQVYERRDRPKLQWQVTISLLPL